MTKPEGCLPSLTSPVFPGILPMYLFDSDSASFLLSLGEIHWESCHSIKNGKNQTEFQWISREYSLSFPSLASLNLYKWADAWFIKVKPESMSIIIYSNPALYVCGTFPIILSTKLFFLLLSFPTFFSFCVSSNFLDSLHAVMGLW